MATFEDDAPRRRVLCLHGGGSRGEILRMQLRAARRPRTPTRARTTGAAVGPLFAAAIGKGLALDFECVDAPFETQGDDMLEAFYPGKFYSYFNRTTSAKSSYAPKDLYPETPVEGRGSYVRRGAPRAAPSPRDRTHTTY